MSRDICLRGADEADVMAALRDCWLTVIDEHGLERPTSDPWKATITWIGAMYRETGNTIIVDGVPTPERALVPGFHANVCPPDGSTMDLSPLKRIQVFPVTPQCVTE